MPIEPKRRLVWIPIIHTQVDQGSMSESIRKLYVRKQGQRKWDQHVRAIEKKWSQIEVSIDDLNLSYSSVRLYQDGLPVCGQEAAIVDELARAGSRNHGLLLKLVGKGARLTGTESPELLLEEYELARHVLVSLESHRGSAAASSQRERSKSLLERRDRFIARRIDETLEPNETGLLFLGLLHSLKGYLPPDISVRRLDSVVRGGGQ
jgi:hypothetical protein